MEAVIAALVHADAYRLNSPAEVDDLDLDASLETSVTVVESGSGRGPGSSGGSSAAATWCCAPR